ALGSSCGPLVSFSRHRRGWASGGMTMRSFRSFVCAGAATFLIASLVALSFADPAAAQTPSPSPTEKLNAYVGCINRLSERSYESRARYFSWVGKNGP